MSQFRVSPPRVFPVATRSSRPPAEAAGSPDAHRQAGFILGGDIELLVEALNMEGDLARQSGTSKFRNHVVASTMATWSRSWLLRLEALHALEWGNYVAAVELVRAGSEMLRAADALLASAAMEWTRWLDAGGIAAAHDDHATELRYEALQTPSARVGALNEIADAASVLASPVLATSVLFSAPESTPSRVASVFGDRDFHVALGELTLGWLLSLSAAWLDTLAAGDAFPPPDPDVLARWRTAVDRALARRDRCRMEALQRDGERRFMIHNWRRAPGGAPRRILL